MVVSGFAGALLLALVCWRLLRPMLAEPAFPRGELQRRANPCGRRARRRLAVLAGAVLLSPAVLWSDDGPLLGRSLSSAVTVAVGFGLFGLLDDLVGTGTRRGFRGHVGALRHGELTTGLLKLVGGGLVAVGVAAVALGRRHVAPPRRRGARQSAGGQPRTCWTAPERVGKVSLLVFVLLAAVSRLDVDLHQARPHRRCGCRAAWRPI